MGARAVPLVDQVVVKECSLSVDAEPEQALTAFPKEYLLGLFMVTSL